MFNLQEFCVFMIKKVGVEGKLSRKKKIFPKFKKKMFCKNHHRKNILPETAISFAELAKVLIEVAKNFANMIKFIVVKKVFTWCKYFFP